MTKILMVIDEHFPPDLRLEKEIPVLKNSGYELTLVCYRKKGQALEEILNGVRIIRTRIAISHSLKGYFDILNSIFFINWPIKRTLNSLNDEYDIVHAHDLPVSNTVINWAKNRKIKTVLDLHENYADALSIWFAWRKSLLVKIKNRLFFSYDKWMSREKKMVQDYDKVIAVIDEMKDRLIAMYEIPEKKVYVVRNSEPKNRFDGDKVTEVESGPLDIVYVGGIGPHRGLDVAILGMPELVKFNPDFKLVIVGTGNPDNIDHLKKVAREAGVANNVVFKGRKPFGEALGYMKGAFMNIIPHLKIPQNDNGLPHKLFQIMNSQYPLLVSSCDPLERILKTENCGSVFEAGNPKSFSEKIIWAYHHQEQVKEMAKNGRKAIQEGNQNWEYDSKILLKTYSDFS